MEEYCAKRCPLLEFSMLIIKELYNLYNVHGSKSGIYLQAVWYLNIDQQVYAITNGDVTGSYSDAVVIGNECIIGVHYEYYGSYEYCFTLNTDTGEVTTSC
jgi:hypothetical protein